MTKMTYSNALATVLAMDSVKANAELAEKLTTLKASVDKKASGEHKPTKTQEANEGIKVAILEVLRSAEKPMTATEIGKAIDSEMSNQKVSALLRQLVNAEKPQVVKTVEGRKSLFSAC